MCNVGLSPANHHSTLPFHLRRHYHRERLKDGLWATSINARADQPVSRMETLMQGSGQAMSEEIKHRASRKDDDAAE